MHRLINTLRGKKNKTKSIGKEVSKAQDHTEQFNGLQRLGRGEMASYFHSRKAITWTLIPLHTFPNQTLG